METRRRPVRRQDAQAASGARRPNSRNVEAASRPRRQFWTGAQRKNKTVRRSWRPTAAGSRRPGAIRSAISWAFDEGADCAAGVPVAVRQGSASCAPSSRTVQPSSCGRSRGWLPLQVMRPLHVIECEEAVMDQGLGDPGRQSVTFPSLGSQPILFERGSFAPSGDGQAALPRNGCCSPGQLRHGRMVRRTHRLTA